MKHINKLYLLIIILLSTVVCHGADLEKMYQPYYKQLDKVRENKQEELVRYLKRVESVAKSIGSDSEMKDLFIMKRHLYNQTKTAAMTQEQKDIQQFLRNSIIDRYMDRYLVFYDLLFIDEAGDIFYTNRRQGDYRKNIFKGKLAKTALSKHLKNDSKYSFVDYQNFEVSAEPSAFFMVPFVMNGKKLGWFVLQFAVNRIDDMFSIESNLGRTGEVFLVNEDQYMLTDSRFTAESTILKKHLSSDNILPKFKEKSGHKLVVDYRGFRALSSFNVISVLGSKWLIIAKIDEDEVLTSEYKKMSNRKQNIFIKDTINSINIKKVEKYILKKDIEVDMDEFKRATNGQTLYTH
ncbi:MAG: hypothetical protein C0603_11475 [Denitrovibrio sp.]|nr:MAG: hypothetical protein C0603_11475 [Denitrovibrio sp.]